MVAFLKLLSACGLGCVVAVLAAKYAMDVRTSLYLRDAKERKEGKPIPFLTSVRLDLNNLRKAFEEVGRLLTDDGIFAFMTPGTNAASLFPRPIRVRVAPLA